MAMSLRPIFIPLFQQSRRRTGREARRRGVFSLKSWAYAGSAKAPANKEKQSKQRKNFFHRGLPYTEVLDERILLQSREAGKRKFLHVDFELVFVSTHGDRPVNQDVSAFLTE